MLEFIFTTAAVAYPAYKTIICIESRASCAQWTIYWLTYGLVTHCYDSVRSLFPWMPFLWIIKVANIYWIAYPGLQGAMFLYKGVIRTWWHHEKWLCDKKKYAKKLKDMNEKECFAFEKSQGVLEKWYGKVKGFFEMILINK
jgi:hypothetical protein